MGGLVMATALLGSVIQPSSKFATAPELFLPKYQFCRNDNFSMKHSNNMSSGVCCIISTSTCSATVSTNTTYIRNPGWFKIPSINILWYHQEYDNILMIIITCLQTTRTSEIQGDLIRQHCRLTICMELAELTNNIRWQDPNNITDTEARCLV